MDRNTVLELIPAYALDALDDDERQAVETLLETDAHARQLLAEYRAVADMLAFTVPNREISPTSRSQLQARLAQRQAVHTPILEQPDDSATITEKAKRQAVSRWWVAVAAATVMFVFAMISLLVLLRPAPDPTEEQRIAYGRRVYYEIVDQDGAQRFPIEADYEGVDGDLVISPDGERVVLRLQDLPVLDESQSFQLWLIDSEKNSSGGVYQWPDGHGPYYLVLHLEKPLAEYVRFGMSIEPAGGSEAPTGPRVWVLPLASSQEL
jgi:anti-sigma-K factor RskA